MMTTSPDDRLLLIEKRDYVAQQLIQCLIFDIQIIHDVFFDIVCVDDLVLTQLLLHDLQVRSRKPKQPLVVVRVHQLVKLPCTQPLPELGQNHTV